MKRTDLAVNAHAVTVNEYINVDITRFIINFVAFHPFLRKEDGGFLSSIAASLRSNPTMESVTREWEKAVGGSSGKDSKELPRFSLSGDARVCIDDALQCVKFMVRNAVALFARDQFSNRPDEPAATEKSVQDVRDYMRDEKAATAVTLADPLVNLRICDAWFDAVGKHRTALSVFMGIRTRKEQIMFITKASSRNGRDLEDIPPVIVKYVTDQAFLSSEDFTNVNTVMHKKLSELVANCLLLPWESTWNLPLNASEQAARTAIRLLEVSGITAKQLPSLLTHIAVDIPSEKDRSDPSSSSSSSSSASSSSSSSAASAPSGRKSPDGELDQKFNGQFVFLQKRPSVGFSHEVYDKLKATAVADFRIKVATAAQQDDHTNMLMSIETALTYLCADFIQ
jgi:hypothetical protein